MQKYNCLIIDFPWSYNNKKTGGSLKSSADSKYNTLSNNQIFELIPLLNKLYDRKLTYLFLWSTNTFLPIAFLFIKNIGFDYKTMITWCKPGLGLGNYFRGNTEHLLVSVIGTHKKPLYCQKPNIIRTYKKLKHSEKPKESYELIEQSTKKILENPQYLELFARQKYQSQNEIIKWTCLGDQISGNSIEVDLKNLSDLYSNSVK